MHGPVVGSTGALLRNEYYQVTTITMKCVLRIFFRGNIEISPRGYLLPWGVFSLKKNPRRGVVRDDDGIYLDVDLHALASAWRSNPN